MSIDAVPPPVATGARPKRKRDWTFLLAAVVLGLVILAAVVAPWITPYDEATVDFGAIWSPPSAEHWLGTDQLGGDLFSRVIFGARPSLLGAIGLLAFAIVVGTTIGVSAAWHRGWVDALLARITDVMFAFPGLLFVVLIISVFGAGSTTAILGMGLAFSPVIAKYTRAIALEELSRPYVDAYRLQGVGGLRLCWRYVLPNMAPNVVGYLVVLFGDGLASLATLNFLGFGSQPPSSDWGLMVQEGRAAVVQGILGPTIVPGLAIALVVVATNIVGVRLSDRLAVRK